MNDLQKVEKYLRFLRDLKESVDANPSVSVSGIIAKHQVSKRCTQALQDGGILRKEGDKRSSKWYWSSPVIPNIKMADELFTRQQKIQNDYNDAIRHAQKLEKQQDEKLVNTMTMTEKQPRVSTPTTILDVRDVDTSKHEVKKTIDEAVRELAGGRPTVQYQEPKLDKSPRPYNNERVNRRVKEVEVKPEREKLFSVLWGVIKVKW